MPSTKYTETLAVYDSLISKIPEIERKGKTMPFTSSNGYMFTLVNNAGEMGIRFSEPVKKKYIEAFNSAPFKSYGATMKGYVLIPEEMFSDKDRLVQLVRESHEYVNSLEPK